jgi:hypothetical protein
VREKMEMWRKKGVEDRGFSVWRWRFMEKIWRNVFRHGSKERRIALEIGN